MNNDDDDDDDDNAVQFGQEPWRPAVTSGNLALLQTLVQGQGGGGRGLAVLTQNAVDKHGNTMTTPLLEAARHHHVDMVRYLLDECSSVVNVNASSNSNDFVDGDVEIRGFTALHFATEHCNLELVRYLVQKKGADVNAVSIRAKSPLHMAAEKGYVDIVQLLIDTGLCNVDLATSKNNDPSEASALLLAVGYGVDDPRSLEIVQYIMEHGPWTDEEKAARATKVLPAACGRATNLAIVRYLVESCGADVNAHGVDACYGGATPLIVACDYGCLNIVEYLVESCRANVQAYGIGHFYQIRNPLLQACKSGHLEIVQYLVKKCDAHVETKQGDGYYNNLTPLHMACLSGKSDIVRYLVETCRVDIEATDRGGNTVLHHAAECGGLDMVQFLVEKCGSNVEAKNGYQRTALSLACGRGRGNMALVKYMVEECNANVNEPNCQGDTALHVASQERHVEMVQYLVQSGRSNVNMVNTVGQTAMYSCLVGTFLGAIAPFDADKCLQIAKIFAACDETNFESRDENGWTILHLACEKDQLQLVQYLVQDCRVNVNATSNTGQTALRIACSERDVAIVQWLTTLTQLDVNVADSKGQTTLHYACSAVGEEMTVRRNFQDRWVGSSDDDSSYQIVQCLLKTGRVNVNAQDNQGKTALHHSVVRSLENALREPGRQKFIEDVCFKIVQALVKTGRANVDATDHTGQTVLHCHCSYPNIDIQRYLIEQAHANMNSMDNEGRTALHRAAFCAAHDSTGLGGGLRLVLFLVNRLSSNLVEYDYNDAER